MQAIGISLVTVAAVAASLAVVWQRQEVRRAEATQTDRQRGIQHLQLEHLRSAGF